MAYLEYRNKKIFYRIEGKGEPVFLIHGFAEDSNIWNEQIEALKEYYLLVIPDLPGSGFSETLHGNGTMEDHADVLKALAAEVILQKKNQLSMIGHSMGGYITLAFAEKYPETLNSFGLFHSSAFADDEQKVALRKKGIEFIKKNGTQAFLKTSVPNLFSDETQKKKPELITRLFDMGKDIAPETLVRYYKAMIMRPDRTEVLKNFDKPVLFIAGKNDNAVPLEASLQQMSMPAVASVHILQNSGHMGMWEEAELSNSVLSKFLRELH